MNKASATKITILSTIVVAGVISVVSISQSKVTPVFVSEPVVFTQPVAVTPVVSVAIKEVETDLECLAKNVYYEAAFEPLKGKQAIAQVTLNRLKTGRWGNTVCDVVYAPSQFSWTLKPDNHKPQGKEWIESQQVAYDFLEKGARLNSLKGSIMYHADYIHPPIWANKKYKVAQIGQHIFYKKDVKI